MAWNYSILVRDDQTPQGLRLYKFPAALTPADESGWSAAMVAVRADSGVAEYPEEPWEVQLWTGEPDPPILAHSTLHDWSAGIP